MTSWLVRPPPDVTLDETSSRVDLRELVIMVTEQVLVAAVHAGSDVTIATRVAADPAVVAKAVAMVTPHQAAVVVVGRELVGGEQVTEAAILGRCVAMETVAGRVLPGACADETVVRLAAVDDVTPLGEEVTLAVFRF